MPITVLKNNVPWGPFTRAQIRDGLGRGDFTLQYLAHAPGLKEWLPLGEVLDYFDRGSHLPPLPASPDLPAVPGGGFSAALPPVPTRPPALPVQPTPLPPPPVLPDSSASLPLPKEPPATELKSAPFIPRFFAFAIDCAVLFLPVVLLFGLGALIIEIQGWVEHTDKETLHQESLLLQRHFHDLLVLVALGGAWLYAALLECSPLQATLGKQWAGLKATDARGGQLSFFRATGRHAAKFLSALPCFLGFTMALFSPRGLAFHDRLADTRVIRK